VPWQLEKAVEFRRDHSSRPSRLVDAKCLIIDCLCSWLRAKARSSLQSPQRGCVPVSDRAVRCEDKTRARTRKPCNLIKVTATGSSVSTTDSITNLQRFYHVVLLPWYFDLTFLSSNPSSAR